MQPHDPCAGKACGRHRPAAGWRALRWAWRTRPDWPWSTSSACPGTWPTPELDAVLRTLTAACHVPMAVVSIASPGLQTYPAEIGVAPYTDVPDRVSFCAEIVETGRPLTVTDASRHPVYAANPRVVAGAIKAYAGHPLVHNGAVVGTVCLQAPGRHRRVAGIPWLIPRARTSSASRSLRSGFVQSSAAPTRRSRGQVGMAGRLEVARNTGGNALRWTTALGPAWRKARRATRHSDPSRGTLVAAGRWCMHRCAGTTRPMWATGSRARSHYAVGSASDQVRPGRRWVPTHRALRPTLPAGGRRQRRAV